MAIKVRTPNSGKLGPRDFTLKRDLTIEEERFVQNVVSGMKICDAYRKAYTNAKDLDNNSATKRGSRILHSEPCQTRFDQLIYQSQCAAILSRQEKLILLSNMVRDPSASDKTKLSALDLLNKMEGEYVKKIEASVNQPINETAKAVADILDEVDDDDDETEDDEDNEEDGESGKIVNIKVG